MGDDPMTHVFIEALSVPEPLVQPADPSNVPLRVPLPAPPVPLVVASHVEAPPTRRARDAAAHYGALRDIS
jgi:hypothetical protein